MIDDYTKTPHLQLLSLYIAKYIEKQCHSGIGKHAVTAVCIFEQLLTYYAQYTPTTRLNSTVASRRRCLLGITYFSY